MCVCVCACVRVCVCQCTYVCGWVYIFVHACVYMCSWLLVLITLVVTVLLFTVMCFCSLYQEANQLEQENKKLKKEVDDLRRALIELETRNGSEWRVVVNNGVLNGNKDCSKSMQSSITNITITTKDSVVTKVVNNNMIINSWHNGTWGLWLKSVAEKDTV